jgi:hypothetical protein
MLNRIHNGIIQKIGFPLPPIREEENPMMRDLLSMFAVIQWVKLTLSH